MTDTSNATIERLVNAAKDAGSVLQDHDGLEYTARTCWEIASALEQLASEREADRRDAGWQAIETAPKDRTILVNDTVLDTPWCAARWLDGDEWSGWIYDEELLLDSEPAGPKPTHWFDAPEPPLSIGNRGPGTGKAVWE